MPYIEGEMAKGIRLNAITRHVLGLFRAVPGARAFRRHLAVEAPEDLRMQLCIGTSLAIIVPTTYRSYVAHKKRGAAIPQVVRLWTLPAIVGVAIGSVTAAYAPGTVFRIAFVIFARFISIRMFAGGERWSLGKELPDRGPQTFYGFITGLFSSLVGVSGGAVSNAVLTMYGQTMQRAVATSAASVCRSRLPAPSATCSPAGSIWRNYRRCRSATCR